MPSILKVTLSTWRLFAHLSGVLGCAGCAQEQAAAGQCGLHAHRCQAGGGELLPGLQQPSITCS